MKKKLMWIVAIIVVALGAGYGGMVFGKSQVKLTSADIQKMSATDRQQLMQGLRGGANGGNFAGGRRTGAGGGANGGGFVNGEILSKDANSLTIKLNDGGSKIVFLSNKTTINKMATGTPADLEVGKNVMINGSAGNDGSVTAESIQLRPAFSPNAGQN